MKPMKSKDLRRREFFRYSAFGLTGATLAQMDLPRRTPEADGRT